MLLLDVERISQEGDKMGEVILTMNDIDKSFPGVHALDHVHFDVKRGEVHALMGENGAGKSTLMKVLTGIYTKDSGTIEFEGKEVEFHNAKEAQDAGVVIVHQELNMVGHLTVAQNIFIGREFKKGLKIDDKKMNEEARKLFQRLNIDIDPTDTMSDLTVGKQQMCEIAKAISHEAKVIVFDEPSAALTESEIAELFKIIRDLKEQQLGIVYISHRMDEIKVITDRVTVMRDGGYVGTLITKDCTKDDIINMMVGRVIYEEPKTKSLVPEDAPVVLKVEHLNAGKMVQDVSFELRKGEILGFSGLMGAGRTETARAIFGADPKESGDIYINGKKVEINSPEDAVKNGIGYLSEDRKRFGIVVQKTIAENSTLATLEKYMKGIFINKKKENEVTKKYVDSLATKTPSIDQLVVNLSGGNQQKVVIAKWLVRDSEILIFDEPTRGIDVGAKNEIYKLMNRLAAEGKSIIMISSEMTEILRMSDRIIVMCEGKVTGELGIEEVSQEKIMNMATREIS
jgi:ribose transport system ATP-binding protein